MTKKNQGQGASKALFAIFFLAVLLFAVSFYFSDKFSDVFFQKRDRQEESGDNSDLNGLSDKKTPEKEVLAPTVTGFINAIDPQSSSFTVEERKNRDIFVTSKTVIKEVKLVDIEGTTRKRVEETDLSFKDLQKGYKVEVISPGFLTESGIVNARTIRVLFKP